MSAGDVTASLKELCLLLPLRRQWACPLFPEQDGETGGRGKIPGGAVFLGFPVAMPTLPFPRALIYEETAEQPSTHLDPMPELVCLASAAAPESTLTSFGTCDGS